MTAHQVETPSGVRKYIPILQWLPAYQSDWLRLDIVAGLTTAAVIIPQAMAYATIAGLPVELGLYAVLALMIVYAVLGTSRVLMVSVTSTISILTASTLLSVVDGGDSASYMTAAATLALLVGLFLILAGIFRLGILANLISQPVLTGFKAGVGVVIFVGQIGKVLGVSIERAPILQTLLALLQSLDEIHWATFGVGLLTLAILIFLPRIAPQIPAALVAVFLAILASSLLNLESLGVDVVGAIPAGLPVPELPDMSLLSQLWPGALGIALMSFIESNAAGRSFARKGDPPINANQELVALGIANVVSGFFQAYPGGGGTSVTAVNYKAGAKSQLSSIVIVGSVILTLLFLASLIGFLPQATLGAMVMIAAAGLINIKDFQAIRRIRNTEFMWAIVAFLGVVFLGTLEGILIAVFISILTIMYQASYPPLYVIGRKVGTDVFRPLSDEHPTDETFPDLLIMSTTGRLNFASAPNILDKLWELVNEADPTVVLLDFSAVPDIEYSALSMLIEFEEALAARGIALWLAALEPVPLKVIRQSILGEKLGRERLYFNLEQAVEAFLMRESS